jgi:hypothetical protein
MGCHRCERCGNGDGEGDDSWNGQHQARIEDAENGDASQNQVCFAPMPDDVQGQLPEGAPDVGWMPANKMIQWPQSEAEEARIISHTPPNDTPPTDEIDQLIPLEDGPVTINSCDLTRLPIKLAAVDVELPSDWKLDLTQPLKKQLAWNPWGKQLVNKLMTQSQKSDDDMKWMALEWWERFEDKKGRFGWKARTNRRSSQAWRGRRSQNWNKKESHLHMKASRTETELEYHSKEESHWQESHRQDRRTSPSDDDDDDDEDEDSGNESDDSWNDWLFDAGICKGLEALLNVKNVRLADWRTRNNAKYNHVALSNSRRSSVDQVAKEATREWRGRKRDKKAMKRKRRGRDGDGCGDGYGDGYPRLEHEGRCDEDGRGRKPFAAMLSWKPAKRHKHADKSGFTKGLSIQGQVESNQQA